MARKITLAVLQSALTDDADKNIKRISDLVREAASKGAKVILPSELFQGPYFCVAGRGQWFARAYAWRESPAVKAMAKLAAELGVVIPVSIFEKEGPHYFNSVVMIDADGELMGVYRKSHIPDGPGYQEKYYFRPGDTGFRVWDTRTAASASASAGTSGIPNARAPWRCRAPTCCSIPTAIGTEPHDASLDTAAPWRRAMQGHAVSNVTPVAAANRIGNENGLHAFVGGYPRARQSARCRHGARDQARGGADENRRDRNPCNAGNGAARLSR
jgi:N-carbamoylputrescine amidase